MRLVRNLAFLFFLGVVISANPATLKADPGCFTGCSCFWDWWGGSVDCSQLVDCGGENFCSDASILCSQHCGTIYDFYCQGGSECNAQCSCMMFD